LSIDLKALIDFDPLWINSIAFAVDQFSAAQASVET